MGRNNDILEGYTGATVLTFLTEYTSLSIDQINFISCQLFALLLSSVLKSWVRAPIPRLWYCFVCGLAMCVFCFGSQTFHIVASAGLSWIVMRNARGGAMPWLVFAVSMVYLSFLHLKRQFYDRSHYALDITGPLMVLTQKVTSLAFSLRDGTAARDKSTPLQRRYAVSTPPSPLQFCSYVFQFQSMLAGPLVFYRDYLDFIEREASPSPAGVVAKKVLASVVVAVLFLKLGSHYRFEYVRDPDFLDATSFGYKLLYLTLATTLERCKYYHAWILADAVCNASGLGYDRSRGTWDLVSNVDALNFELGLNMKESLDCWNVGTMRWLRLVVYERAGGRWKTGAVYVVSAFWHGFYPGYYVTFVSGALFTVAGRAIRKSIRPLFLANYPLKRFYDALTWLCTRVLIAYVTFSFVVQDFWPSLEIFIRLYFFMHVGAALSLPLATLIGRALVGASGSAAGETESSLANGNGVGKSTGAPGRFQQMVSKEYVVSRSDIKLKTG